MINFTTIQNDTHAHMHMRCCVVLFILQFLFTCCPFENTTVIGYDDEQSEKNK